jgi:glucoamylase
MNEIASIAPGAPGLEALWSPGAKTGVGTALSHDSSVWFTTSHGILTEVFYPFVDTASVRDLEFLVTDRKEFFSEEKRDTYSEVSYLAPGVPAFKLVNTCKRGRYRIEKQIVTDPLRSTILLQIRFEALEGQLQDYAIFVLLNPHLGNQGCNNLGWVGEFKGTPMLFARGVGSALALASSTPWRNRSAGFVGVSDGWQDLSRHKQMRWHYDRAPKGNVALTGEIDLASGQDSFLLALSFGRDENEAGHRARGSLLHGYAAARDAYLAEWTDWQKGLLPLDGSVKHPQDMYRISAMVMRAHESKHIPGGIVASLAVPWGFAKKARDRGYHLVWPRDMIETIGGMLACERHDDARRVISYFQITQEADGHWPQNMFLDGRPNWNGIQLDETAFVILLVNLAWRYKALEDEAVADLWPMVRSAAAYLVQHGPVSPMDRWEEQEGYFASTMAVEIPALLVAADLAEKQGETGTANYLRETADAWNDSIEELIYVTGTNLARRVGVDGYYVRFARPDQLSAPLPACGETVLKNHLPGQGRFPVAEIVSPDVLCLVRFGLRAAEDPRIVNSLRVIDHCLKVETPFGPCWHRYPHDGYGEHADGSPFDGTGIGRVWPLMTGERAHYELAAGRKEEAHRLLEAMEAFANESGLLPEQIWDSPDIPEHELCFGRPSGSAMPLVWAHAEYVKLRRSLHDGKVFDMPPQSAQRYIIEKKESPHVLWRFEQKRRTMRQGKILRLETMPPAIVHWSSDGWKTSNDLRSCPSGLGVHVTDIPTELLSKGTAVVFTFYWPEVRRWEGANFSVLII